MSPFAQSDAVIVRFWPMLLKKSVTRADYATIESRRPTIRLQRCASDWNFESKLRAGTLKIFFQHYRPDSAAEAAGGQVWLLV
jgi:hypothetical protein